MKSSKQLIIFLFFCIIACSLVLETNAQDNDFEDPVMEGRSGEDARESDDEEFGFEAESPAASGSPSLPISSSPSLPISAAPSESTDEDSEDEDKEEVVASPKQTASLQQSNVSTTAAPDDVEEKEDEETPVGTVPPVVPGIPSASPPLLSSDDEDKDEEEVVPSPPESPPVLVNSNDDDDELKNVDASSFGSRVPSSTETPFPSETPASESSSSTTASPVSESDSDDDKDANEDEKQESSKAPPVVTEVSSTPSSLSTTSDAGSFSFSVTHGSSSETTTVGSTSTESSSSESTSLSPLDERRRDDPDRAPESGSTQQPPAQPNFYANKGADGKTTSPPDGKPKNDHHDHKKTRFWQKNKGFIPKSPQEVSSGVKGSRGVLHTPSYRPVFQTQYVAGSGYPSGYPTPSYSRRQYIPFSSSPFVRQDQSAYNWFNSYYPSSYSPSSSFEYSSGRHSPYLSFIHENIRRNFPVLPQSSSLYLSRVFVHRPGSYSYAYAY